MGTCNYTKPEPDIEPAYSRKFFEEWQRLLKEEEELFAAKQYRASDFEIFARDERDENDGNGNVPEAIACRTAKLLAGQGFRLRDITPHLPLVIEENDEPPRELRHFYDPQQYWGGGFIRELPPLKYTLRRIYEWMDSRAYCHQPKLTYAGAISLMAHLAGRNFGSGPDRSALYIFNISATASGKENPQACAKEVLGALSLTGSDDAVSEAVILKRLEEHKKFYWLADECGMILKQLGRSNASYQQGIISTFLKLYTKANQLYKRDAATDGLSREVQSPCLNILASSTPEEFFGAVTSADEANGFLNRLMIFTGDKEPFEGDEPEQLPPPHGLLDILHSVARINPPQTGANVWSPKTEGVSLIATPDPPYVPHDLPKTPEAVTEKQLFRQHCGSLKQNGYRGFWGRASEKASRLALVHAVSRHGEAVRFNGASWDDAEVMLEDMHWGCCVAYVITKEYEALSKRHIASGEFSSLQKKVIEKVEEMVEKRATTEPPSELGEQLGVRGELVFTRSEITRKTQHINWRDGKHRSQVLYELAEQGVFRVVELKAEDGGRGREYWLFNPSQN